LQRSIFANTHAPTDRCHPEGRVVAARRDSTQIPPNL
jgi:hypothetical protein